MSYTNDKCQQDEVSEKGVAANINTYSDEINSIHQLQKSFLSDDNGSTIPVQEIYDYCQSQIPSDVADLATIAMCPGNQIISNSTENFMMDAFPHLFPFGLGTYTRKKFANISLQEYITHRLCCKSDFQIDFLFNCFVYDMLQKEQVFQAIHYKVSSMSLATTARIAKYTIEDINLAIKNTQCGIFDEESFFITNHLKLAGGKAKFSQLSKSTNRTELRSMLINKGSPSLYVTISSNDITNILAYTFCMKDPSLFDYDCPDITDSYFRATQASKNPVGLANFFNTLIDTVINYLFGWSNENHNGIFGKISGYYGMVETQNRGTLHIHMLIWLEGSPDAQTMFDKLSSDSDFQDKMIKYVTSIIHTGSELQPVNLNEDNLNLAAKSFHYNPTPEMSPSFAQCINKQNVLACKTYQKHVHCGSCFKNTNISGCRYRKPDQISEITEWISKTGSFLLRKSDGMINNFNPYLTMLTNSNTDIQFLTSGYIGLAIIHYVANYITKSSIGVESMYILQKAALESALLNPLKTAPFTYSADQGLVRTFFIKFFNNLIKCSQVSATEITTKLLGLQMNYTSHTYTSLNLYSVMASLNQWKVCY